MSIANPPPQSYRAGALRLILLLALIMVAGLAGAWLLGWIEATVAVYSGLRALGLLALLAAVVVISSALMKRR